MSRVRIGVALTLLALVGLGRPSTAQAINSGRAETVFAFCRGPLQLGSTY
jgi:hypothetical protein